MIPFRVIPCPKTLNGKFPQINFLSLKVVIIVSAMIKNNPSCCLAPSSQGHKSSFTIGYKLFMLYYSTCLMAAEKGGER